MIAVKHHITAFGSKVVIDPKAGQINRITAGILDLQCSCYGISSGRIIVISHRDLKISYGSLTALQQCAQPIGNIIIQGSVNTLGISAAAAYSAVRKIEDIGLLPGRSISSAMTAVLALPTVER